MWSFQYTDQILHSIKERQWFPQSKKENQSSLDALEREEESHQSKMRDIAQIAAKPPIGVPTKSGQQRTSSASSQLDVSMEMEEQPPRPRFWNIGRNEGTPNNTTLDSSTSSREGMS